LLVLGVQRFSPFFFFPFSGSHGSRLRVIPPPNPTEGLGMLFYVGGRSDVFTLLFFFRTKADPLVWETPPFLFATDPLFSGQVVLKIGELAVSPARGRRRFRPVVGGHPLFFSQALAFHSLGAGHTSSFLDLTPVRSPYSCPSCTGTCLFSPLLSVDVLQPAH